MFLLNAPIGFGTVLDRVLKQLVHPYVRAGLHVLVKEFGKTQTPERQLGYYHKDRNEAHFVTCNKGFTVDEITAGIEAWECECALIDYR